MEWGDLFLNTLIGLLSGLISGWFVSHMLKKDADAEILSRQIDSDIQTFQRYLNALRLEIEMISKELESKESVDYKQIVRMLEDDPITRSFTKENITAESLDSVKEARDLIQEILLPAKHKEITYSSGLRFASRLQRARIRILVIKEK
ncbi:hypothetical protein [Bacillus cereus]|uniref:hypothetical protein n=1 Tax=Bacillus cereus TaxID=1396 RepID=UPI0011453A50|nr:hypothetical protein [Bacillus cereus]